MLARDLSRIAKLPDRVLGVGASGTVYLGIDTTSGEMFAIKEIPLPPSATTPTTSTTDSKNTAAMKLKNEIDICCRIHSHPNVVCHYGSRIDKSAAELTNIMMQTHEQSPLLSINSNAANNNNNNSGDFADSNNNDNNPTSSDAQNLAASSSVPPLLNIANFRLNSGSHTAVTNSNSTNNNEGVAFGNDEHHQDPQHDGHTQYDKVLDIIMEYVPGGSLSNLIRNLGERPLPEALARNFARDIVRGVDHLHNTVHVSHRDVKGENVLIGSSDGRGVCKITDYGTAKMRFAAPTPTHQGGNNNFVLQSQLLTTVCGTAAYMAPEVCQATSGASPTNSVLNNNNNNNNDNDNTNEPATTGAAASATTSAVGYTSSCDIWSVGCVVYEMLCGHPPRYNNQVEAANVFAIMFALASDDTLVPVIPDEIKRGLSKDAVAFVTQCCVRDPKARPTAQQLLQHPWIVGGITTTPKQVGAIAIAQQQHPSPLSASSTTAPTTTTSVASASSTSSIVPPGSSGKGGGILLENGAFVDVF